MGAARRCMFAPEHVHMNRPLAVIFTAIVLDAVGIGLIFPILPSLLQEVTHAENVAPYIGIMTALYAIMQFICAPVLGSLSDRLGRRPVLLISIAGCHQLPVPRLRAEPVAAADRPGHCGADQRQYFGGHGLYHRHFA